MICRSLRAFSQFLRNLSTSLITTSISENNLILCKARVVQQKAKCTTFMYAGSRNIAAHVFGTATTSTDLLISTHMEHAGLVHLYQAIQKTAKEAEKVQKLDPKPIHSHCATEQVEAAGWLATASQHIQCFYAEQNQI